MSEWDDPLRAAEDTVCLPAGTLTVAGLKQFFDELWDAGRVPSAAEVDGYGARAGMPADPFCGAVLFAPDDGLRQALRLEVIVQQGFMDPWTAGYLNSPMQGPAPLRCALEPHPAGTWHWDGRGTWFR